MIRLYFLITLAVIKADNGFGFKPMNSESWNEATYLTYIKNMAMYPQVTPMSRQEFEKTSINREGKTFDFGDFQQKFNNFEHTQNVNDAQTNNENVYSFGNLQTSASNFVNVNPHNPGINTPIMQSTYNPVSVPTNNFGNAFGVPPGAYAQNNLQTQFSVNANPHSFGGALNNQKHAIFGGVLPPINIQTTAPEKFQSSVDAFMGTPGANSDFINLLREQQKQQSQTSQIVYPSTSYGSPIPGSYPQPPPPPSAQQEEVLKLMKLLLSKIDGQATTPMPTAQSKPEFEFKLSIPKHIKNSADSKPEYNSFSLKGKDHSESNIFKEFDFGPGAEIISNPVKSLGDYRQHDSFQISNQKFKDDEYHFHPPPTKIEHVHTNPMNFRLPVKQPEKFHHSRNAPNRFQNGFEYPSLTHEGYRKPPHKRNHRSRKSRAPAKNATYRFKITKA